MSIPGAPASSAAIAALFNDVAGTYDDVGVPWFRPIARRLVRELAPTLGERALDIGCGKGAALFPLAEAVGPAGFVTGIDVSSNMVRATGNEAETRGLSHVGLHVMDAMTPQLRESSYDLAAASFVLFFLPEPVAALRAWRKLLVPGGRIGISTFAERGAGWLDEVFRPYVPPSFSGTRPNGSRPFESDAGVERLMETAGFTSVRTTNFELEAVFADVNQWRDWSLSHGQLAVWRRISRADHQHVLAAASKHLEKFRAADGQIRLVQPIRLTFGLRSN